jgi:uncharacterized protein YceH (UPF0502 family)
VLRLARQPGQKEARFRELLMGEAAVPVQVPPTPSPEPAAPTRPISPAGAPDVASLRDEVASLRAEVTALRHELAAVRSAQSRPTG